MSDEPEQQWEPMPAKNDERKIWTGRLFKGEQEGTVQGWLYRHFSDEKFSFVGSRNPRGAGYVLIARKVK